VLPKGQKRRAVARATWGEGGLVNEGLLLAHPG
jgi:hypothetical protein